MSETKSSLLDKRIEQFFDSSRELLTEIHARNESESNGTSNKKRKRQKPISIPKTEIDTFDPNADRYDGDPSGI